MLLTVNDSACGNAKWKSTQVDTQDRQAGFD